MRPVLALALLTAPASAAIERTGPAGFVVIETATVRATPAAAWDTLITPARWWSSGHSWSGDAANLSLDPRPGGCFCERLPGGGGVEHLRVVFVAPGKELRLVGALGPLQTDAVAGAMMVTIVPAGAGSVTLTLRYAVSGQPTMGSEAMAPLVDAVLAEQVARLQAAAEAAH